MCQDECGVPTKVPTLTRNALRNTKSGLGDVFNAAKRCAKCARSAPARSQAREGGIRTLPLLCVSVSYRLRVAQGAKIATDAVNHCTLLHAARNPPCSLIVSVLSAP